MKVFPGRNGERKAVKWLGNSGFLNVVFDQNVGWLENVGICKQIIRNCSNYLDHIGLKETEIRNYVKAFEIDYISLRGISYPGMRPPFGGEKPIKIIAGVEAKYFYASNLENDKYHTGVGQLVEYLKWGFDIVVLVHIFDNEIGKAKINEFAEPALRLISCLRDTYRLSLGYAYLIVDENAPRESYHKYLQGNSIWSYPGTLQNPFETEPSTIRIRESIERYFLPNV